ncbi:hypothetical protein JTB14_009958 [Gonioctena quinquepunctata]|nr:hypothetical protein JTB14_009958 [Gonioctena quinquepunctata]
MRHGKDRTGEGPHEYQKKEVGTWQEHVIRMDDGRGTRRERKKKGKLSAEEGEYKEDINRRTRSSRREEHLDDETEEEGRRI